MESTTEVSEKRKIEDNTSVLRKEDSKFSVRSASSLTDSNRLTHQQRIQIKETMAKKEKKMKIYKTIWYTKWRQIYDDPNSERVIAAKAQRQQIKNLLKFTI